MDHYITEEQTINGKTNTIAIIYYGHVLKSLTFASILEDRRKVFGDNWKQTMTYRVGDTIVVSLKKQAGARVYKSELR